MTARSDVDQWLADTQWVNEPDDMPWGDAMRVCFNDDGEPVHEPASFISYVNRFLSPTLDQIMTLALLECCRAYTPLVNAWATLTLSRFNADRIRYIYPTSASPCF
jgi:hypothetical protein